MHKSRQLTARQVRSIRLQHKSGNTIVAISLAFNRSRRTIADLLHGKTYSRVPDDVLTPELPGQAERERLEQRRQTERERRPYRGKPLT